MPVYQFVDKNARVGDITRFTMVFPGSIQDAINYVQKQGLGRSHQKFQVYDVTGMQGATLLATELNLGTPQNGQQPQMSREGVLGGLPTGAPVGQRQARPTGEVDMHSHFQPLGDDALPAGGDAMFGDLKDGTYSDLIGGPGNIQEQPRPPGF